MLRSYSRPAPPLPTGAAQKRCPPRIRARAELRPTLNRRRRLCRRPPCIGVLGLDLSGPFPPVPRRPLHVGAPGRVPAGPSPPVPRGAPPSVCRCTRPNSGRALPTAPCEASPSAHQCVGPSSGEQVPRKPPASAPGPSSHRPSCRRSCY